MRLQTKLLGVLVPVGVASAGTVLAFSGGSVRAVLVESEAERVFVELADTSARAVAGMEAGSERELLPLLQEAMRRNDAVYAMALDPSGKVLAHSNVLEKGKYLTDAASRRAAARERPGFEILETPTGPVLDASVPVWAPEADFMLANEEGGLQSLGVIRMGRPLAEAAATRSRILARIAFIMLAAGLVAALVLGAMLRKLLSPIRELAAGAERIAQGRYDVSVPVRSADELGGLAADFNRMGAELGRTSVSKDFLDGVIRGIADAVFVTNQAGVILMVNPAGIAMLERPEEEVVGQPLSAFLESGAAEAVLGAGPVRDLESIVRAVGAREVPIMVSASALRGRDGSVEGAVSVAKDLTALKDSEAALRGLQGMLAQSEKMSAVGQLAAGVAHEINNPLGVILGFAQSVLRRLKPDDELAMPVRSIEREAQRCTRLVKNLLAFSRQNHARAEEIDVNEAVLGTLELVEANAKVHGVELARELEASGRVVGDRVQVQQVIVNLCNNAVDAMAGRSGKVTVRTRDAGTASAPTVRIEVEDNGVGIPDDVLVKIYNPFFTTKEVGRGTGLGLSLVHEIVERHKWNITVRSLVGAGTTFVVTLPVAAGRG